MKKIPLSAEEISSIETRYGKMYHEIRKSIASFKSDFDEIVGEEEAQNSDLCFLSWTSTLYTDVSLMIMAQIKDR